MMRRAGWIAAAAMLLSAGGATAVISQAAMPDIARQHYERQNCHGAYDVLVEQLDNGSRPSEAEVAWARRVLSAFEASRGAATAVDGKMVDKPVVERAMRVCEEWTKYDAT